MGLLDNTTQGIYYRGQDGVQRSGDENYGSYQFVSLNDIINQFMIVYVGEDKIISKASRIDVGFHAQRALAELSYDTLKSFKSQEIEIPNSLKMILPHDYVSYIKLSWIDNRGIKHFLRPTDKTLNPTPIKQNDDGDYMFDYSMPIVATATVEEVTIDSANGFSETGPGPTLTFTQDPEAYHGITVGSVVTGTTINSHVTVVAVNDPVDSTVILSSAPSQSGSQTFTFSAANFFSDDLQLQVENEIELTDCSYTSGSNIIIDLDNPTGTSVVPGMRVRSAHHIQGTYVISVTQAHIKVSTDATANGSSPTAVTFLNDIPVSDSWSKYKSTTPSENDNDDDEDNVFWPSMGQRYGLDPQHAQVNGSFYIDDNTGYIHFSSNVSGKTIVLEYISDSLGTDEEMKVHKFAEEAMYKYIAHAILAGKSNIPEFQVNRFKKEKFAEIRKAKLRLSNINLEELTQILRGKSKHIKH